MESYEGCGFGWEGNMLRWCHEEEASVFLDFWKIHNFYTRDRTYCDRGIVDIPFSLKRSG